jgi:hypothetical protein
LRHTAGTLAAQHGATLAELKRLLGHSSTRAAMRYQHAADVRLRAIAERVGAEVEAEQAKIRRPEQAVAAECQAECHVESSRGFRGAPQSGS